MKRWKIISMVLATLLAGGVIASGESEAQSPLGVCYQYEQSEERFCTGTCFTYWCCVIDLGC